MNRTTRCFLVLVVLSTATIPGGAAGTPDRPETLAGAPAKPAHDLTHDEVTRLWEEARGVRDVLSRLRALTPTAGSEPTPARGQKIQALNVELRAKLDAFLAAAGLSAAELVRLIDSDGGIDNGKLETAPPRIEPYVPVAD